jgi:NADH:ubiquinone oxidoreductase subunit K
MPVGWLTASTGSVSAIIVALYRSRQTIDVEDLTSMRG